MSTVNYDHSFDTSRVDVSRAISGSRRQTSRPLHRISEVRQQQGASLRSVSRRLDMTVQEIRDRSKRRPLLKALQKSTPCATGEAKEEKPILSNDLSISCLVIMIWFGRRVSNLIR